MMAAVSGPIRAFVSTSYWNAVKGTPSDRFGYSAAKLNQKMSWTSTGVPRKKVM